jgi:hypothetical protein
MTFPAIQDPTGPEEFSWEVQLREGQELRQIDDRHAAVYSNGFERFVIEIEAVAAHDAVGTTVPTTLAVTQPNVITLTVQHRAGNPAAGGAPFDYPVNAGSGWEGGIQIHHVQMPPAEASPPPAAPVAAVVPVCLVPDLAGKSLKASRRMLRNSGCSLGPVRGERARGAKVARQYASRAAGSRPGPWSASSSAEPALQPRTPEREKAHGQHRPRPVDADDDGEQARQPGERRPEQRQPDRQPQDPGGEGGAEHPGRRAGEPPPVFEELLRQSEGERKRENGDRGQLQQRRPPERREVHRCRG